MSLRWRLVSCVLILVLLPLSAPAIAQDSSVIMIGTTDLPTSLDVGQAYDFAAWEVLQHLYVGLMRQTPGTLDYETALAAGYTVSEDQITYTFTLRADAAFSDGTPITAQTFVDSINRVIALEEDAASAVTPYVERVSVNDEDQLVFQLKRPLPYFLGLLALPPYFPQHPTLVASPTPQQFAENGVIGNGPYLLERYDVGGEIVLQANPAYEPQPATPTIILKQYMGSQELRAALEKHDVDIAWRALFLDDLLEVTGEEGLNVTSIPSTRVFYLYMNHDLEPADDPLVREALTLLLNRQRVVDNTLHGYAAPLTSMVPDLFSEAYHPIWPEGSALDEANEILRSAAYRTGSAAVRLNFAIETSLYLYGDLYVAAAGELRRGSFEPSDYTACGVSWNSNTTTFTSSLEAGERQIAMFAWTPLVPHPAAYLYPLAHSSQPIPANGKYASAEIDQLLDAAMIESDPAVAGPLYQQAAALLLEKFDIAPLWQETMQIVAWDGIGGIQLEPNYFLHYDLLTKQ